MPDSPLLRAPIKVAHRITLKNKMLLKKFQVIWQPYDTWKAEINQNNLLFRHEGIKLFK